MIFLFAEDSRHYPERRSGAGWDDAGVVDVQPRFL